MIDDSQSRQTKWPLTTTTSPSSNVYKEMQDSRETPIYHSCSDVDSDNCDMELHPPTENNSIQILCQDGDDIFENEFEASIEQGDAEFDGFASDTESCLSDDNLENASGKYGHSPSTSSESDIEEGKCETYISTKTQISTLDIFRGRAHLMPFVERRRLSQCKEEDEDDGDKSSQYQGIGNERPVLNFIERHSTKLTSLPLPPQPATLFMNDKASVEKFKDLERLRQQFMHKIDNINTRNVNDIKTIDVAEINNISPPPPPVPPSILPPALINLLQSAKALSPKLPVLSISDQDINTSQNNSNSIESTCTSQPLIIKGKFTVTKALEEPVIDQIKPEVKQLRLMPLTSNAHTISFSYKYNTHPSVKTIFPQYNKSDRKSLIQPHLSKEFFDSSLVEIRNLNESFHSLNKQSSVSSNGNIVDNQKTTFPYVLDDVWIKQTKSLEPMNAITHSTEINGKIITVYSEDEEDAKWLACRPSSAPIESKATRKANKKMKEEAKRQEKEQNRREKEARKIERETAKRLEREAAKLEKLNRNAKKISRSTERVAATPRSGSLERRRSGEDSPVLNQTTVHGIASPNRRPTIFDVFRSSKRQKDKQLLDPLAITNTITTTGFDNNVNSGTTGSGGVINSMKVALQYSGLIGGSHHKQSPTVTITTAEGNSTVKSKYKDGSAHPHQGSDAQYYHTVTAVRRSDFSRSPMTKVMDLFRHRSNSAASEADKRKARAAAHQQQLAVQMTILQLYITIPKCNLIVTFTIGHHSGYIWFHVYYLLNDAFLYVSAYVK